MRYLHRLNIEIQKVARTGSTLVQGRVFGRSQMVSGHSPTLLGSPSEAFIRLEDSVRGMTFGELLRGHFTYALLRLQKALNQTKWKEYFSGGRKYYYNVRPPKSLQGVITN